MMYYDENLENLENVIEEEDPVLADVLPEGEMVELADDELEEVSGGKTRYVVVTGNKVYLRYGPGKGYAHFALVKKGTTLTYEGSKTYNKSERRNWYKIRYNGTIGWIAADYSHRT